MDCGVDRQDRALVLDEVAEVRVLLVANRTVASTSRESTPSHAGLLWEPQGLVQMRVVEDIPEPIYGFAMRPRLIAEYALDLSQRKRENCVAAALQR